MSKINKAELDEWLKWKGMLYSAESVPRGAGSVFKDRLQFTVFGDGGYMVSLGNRTLYKGNNFEQAAAAYNEHSRNE